MTKRKTINDVILVAESMGYTFLGDEYKNNRTKMPFNCPKHGVFFATYYGLTKGGGCPKCGRERGAERRKYSYEYVKRKVEEKGYELISTEYTSAHDKLIIMCKEHGEFKQTLSMFLAGHLCPRCGIEHRAKSHRKNLDAVKKVFSKAGLTIIGEYEKSDKPVKCICRKHGIEYATYNSVKRSGNCPIDGIHRLGEDNPSWKGGSTELKPMLRGLIDPWRQECMRRTGYRCEITGLTGRLNVHHMVGFERIFVTTMDELGLPILPHLCDYSQGQLTEIQNTFLRNNREMANPIVMLQDVHVALHKFCGGYSCPTSFKQLEKFKIKILKQKVGDSG